MIAPGDKARHDELGLVVVMDVGPDERHGRSLKEGFADILSRGRIVRVAMSTLHAGAMQWVDSDEPTRGMFRPPYLLDTSSW